MTDDQDRDATLEKLELTAQPDVEPTLSIGDLDAILDRNQRASRWVTVTAYSIGDVILPTVRNGHQYLVTESGTSGATEPTWLTADGSSVTDGTVELEESGTDYASVYDLRGAIRECWELKAAKASEYISSSDSGNEQMIFEHCQQMVQRYQTPMVV